MLRRTCCVVILLYMSATVSAQTIYWKKDHIYNGPGGKEIATMTPAPSDQTAPTRPLGLGSSELTATSVRLTWTGSIDLGGSHLAGYNVYRGVRPVGTVGVGVVTFVDVPLVPNTSYTYTVRSFDNAQNHSTPSNSVSLTTLSAAGDATAPGIPLNLQGRALSHSQVRLDWHASTDAGGSGLAGYKVYRGGSLISGGSPIAATTYTDSTVVANTAYAYTLIAVDGNGNASAASSAVNVTTPLELLFKDDFNRPDTSPPSLGTGWAHSYTGFFVSTLRAACSSTFGLCLSTATGAVTKVRATAWATPASGFSGVPSGGIAFWDYAQLGGGQPPADVVMVGQVVDDRGAAKAFRMLVKGKDKLRYENGDRITVFVAGGAWVQTGAKLELLPAHAAVRRPEIVPFLDLITEAANPWLEVSSLQPYTLGGKTVQRAVVTLRDPSPEKREFRRALDEQANLYLDPATLLVARSERMIPAANNMDTRFLSTLDFSDYRTVQGFAVPFRIVQTLGTSAAILQRSTITVTSVAFNQGIPDSSFVPATGGKP